MRHRRRYAEREREAVTQARARSRAPAPSMVSAADALEEARSAPAGSLPAASVLALHRAVGNQGVREMLGAGSAAAPIQRKEDDRAAGAAIDARSAPMPPGPGRPLDPTTRSFFEDRFGADFGGVRVHDDAHAAASARDLQARAYTTHEDVVFGAGEYAPGTLAGRNLLAHELTHVVQQRGGGAVRGQDPSLEGEADTVGARAAAGLSVAG